MRDFGIIGLLFIMVFVISHISVDKDFDKNAKVGAYTVTGMFSVLYLIFGLFGG